MTVDEIDVEVGKRERAASKFVYSDLPDGSGGSSHTNRPPDSRRDSASTEGDAPESCSRWHTTVTRMVALRDVRCTPAAVRTAEKPP